MKKQIMFTTCDAKNEKYAKLFEASLRKFHSEEELPLIIIKGEELAKELKEDPNFFYRQKPIIASRLMDEYDLVIGADCDQIITGSLSHILEDNSYDVGTVLNFNRTDFKNYGPITTYNIDCTRYMNCGFVAMRSKAFVEHWLKLCQTEDIFQTLQYREQDLLNILYYYGNYNMKCFDNKDPFSEMQKWHGLIAKGEGLRMTVKDGKVILPKEETGYPNEDVEIKILHWAGGNDAPDKMNWRIGYSEEMIGHLDYLTKEGEKDGK